MYTYYILLKPYYQGYLTLYGNPFLLQKDKQEIKIIDNYLKDYSLQTHGICAIFDEEMQDN